MADPRNKQLLAPPLLALCAALAVLSSFARAAPLEVPASPAEAAPNQTYAGARVPDDQIRIGWEIVRQNPIPGIHVGLVPGSQDAFLHIGRNKFGTPVLPFTPVNGLLDLENRTWINVTTITNTFCGALVPTPDGKLLVVGGHTASPASNLTNGMRDIRPYEYFKTPDELLTAAMMSYARWYPTPTLLPNGRIQIYGGTIQPRETGVSPPNFEIYDPARTGAEQEPLVQHPVEPDFLAAVVQNFYAYNFVLPTGDVYSQLDNLVRFIKPDGTYRQNPATGSYLDVPGFPADIKTQYPRSATAVMTALRPEDGYGSVDIISFGGVPASNGCGFGPPDNLIVAVRTSHRLSISWTFDDAGEPQYTFSDWVEEDMGIPRAGGDSTLLPNGDVVIINGIQTGCSGGVASGARRNLYPAFWPLLYQPDRPVGQRYTVMGATGIVRMYHSTSSLTLNGTLLISGCDACAKNDVIFTPYLGSGVEWYVENFGKNELRDELFSPPYAFDEANMPAIVSIGDNTNARAVVDVAYGSSLDVSWQSKLDGAPLVNVTAVSIVAPSCVTHGFNGNQRVVFLEITEHGGVEGGDTGSLTVKLPSRPEVAPPQMYMLFVMNGKTYGRAWWVRLTAGGAAAEPLA